MPKDTIVPAGMVSDKRMKSGLILFGDGGVCCGSKEVETFNPGRQRIRLPLRRACGGPSMAGLKPVFNPVDDGLEARTL